MPILMNIKVCKILSLMLSRTLLASNTFRRSFVRVGFGKREVPLIVVYSVVTSSVCIALFKYL